MACIDNEFFKKMSLKQKIIFPLVLAFPTNLIIATLMFITFSPFIIGGFLVYCVNLIFKQIATKKES